MADAACEYFEGIEPEPVYVDQPFPLFPESKVATGWTMISGEFESISKVRLKFLDGQLTQGIIFAVGAVIDPRKKALEPMHSAVEAISPFYPETSYHVSAADYELKTRKAKLRSIWKEGVVNLADAVMPMILTPDAVMGNSLQLIIATKLTYYLDARNRKQLFEQHPDGYNTRTLRHLASKLRFQATFPGGVIYESEPDRRLLRYHALSFSRYYPESKGLLAAAPRGYVNLPNQNVWDKGPNRPKVVQVECVEGLRLNLPSRNVKKHISQIQGKFILKQDDIQVPSAFQDADFNF